MKNPFILYLFLALALNVQAQYFDSNEIFNTGSNGYTIFKSDKYLFVECGVQLKNINKSIAWLVLDTNLNYLRSFVPKDTIRYSSGSTHHDGYLVQYGQSTVNKADSAILVKMDTLGNVLKRKVYSTKDNGTRRYLPIKYHNNIPNPRALKCQILTMSGYVIQSGAFDSEKNTNEVDVSKLPVGMYLIKVYDRDWQSMPVKFMKM